MFSCRACLLRSLRAIAEDVSPNRLATSAPSILTTPRSNTLRRSLTSVASATNTNPEYGPLMPGKQPTVTDEEADIRASRKVSKTALSPTVKKHLELELKYLTDPFKLAEHVRDLLERNHAEKALDLVRLASKEMAAVVAWNHIINWHMSRNKIDDAIKIYNEMKKRAQFPDSHTYVLLLRGLARKHHHGQAVKESNVTKAMGIYNSMSSPTSRTPPDIRHANAAMQVCGVARDMDSLWGIFSKLPASGAGAADHVTYSIMLHSIRLSLHSQRPAGTIPAQATRICDKALKEARDVWRSLIPRWRGGEVMLDSQLVCSMARLLLDSTRMEDRDDVFDLIQQTTNIERLIPPLGHPDRHVEHIREEPGASEARESPEDEDGEGFRDLPATKVFRPIKPHAADPAHPKRPTSLAWVAPSTHILSIIIDACTLLRTPKTASAYWDLLTSEYGVQPDAVAFNSQLKLLAENRNSGRVAKILSQDMAAAGLELKNQTFRIAMRACARNTKSPRALADARLVVDKMDETQADLDIHTLIQYLNIALTTDNAVSIVSALNHLDPIVHKLRARVSYGTEESNITPEAHLVDREEHVGFLQSMVGAIDTLMNRGMVERDQYNLWHSRRSNLTQFIDKAKKSIEKRRETSNTLQADLAARKASRLAAREAGRLLRERRYVMKGTSEPRMSKAEWALKVFRAKERRADRVEERRERAKGLLKWNVRDAKNPPTRDDGFADFPMELSER